MQTNPLAQVWTRLGGLTTKSWLLTVIFCVNCICPW